MDTWQSDSKSAALPSWPLRLLEVLRNVLRSVHVHRRERSLRICETLPLGEKRFLAIVQFEGRRFLIGATNQSISLLERLDPIPAKKQKNGPSLENSFLNGVH
ncbi:MAG TPA: flagellar biosynthetic protein FliO [Candidatus Solibacter sp.]|nr:flagellar biosynthetic protein FliO [Candidatus Solibacter sp.]